MKLSVKCLSLSGQSADIWVLDNYLSSVDELAKEEQTAMNVFIEKRIIEQKRSSPFTENEYYHLMVSDQSYQSLSDDEKTAIDVIIRNHTVKKEDKEQVSTTKQARSILKHFYDKYESAIHRTVRENDSLVNALYAKFAWAITVHKAVGSEFNNVILKGFRAENDGICNESYFRWLYSGVSASSGTFYIAQPQYVQPFMNCVVSETDSGVNTGKKVLIFEDYSIPPRFSETVNLKNLSASAAVCELAILLEPKGYILEEVKPSGDYLTKAIFSIPQDIKKRLVIDVHNKGAKDSYGVSAIKIEPYNLVDGNVVKTAIESVMSMHPIQKEVADCPNYIMVVLDSFKEALTDRRVSLELVSAKDYQVICKASSDKGVATLRLWYGTSLENHTKGFINKIEVFDVSDPSITDMVRQSRTMMSK